MESYGACPPFQPSSPTPTPPYTPTPSPTPTPTPTPPPPPPIVGGKDQTSVTQMLNDAIKVGSCYGCYDGGKGVIVRNPFDDYEGEAGKDWQVVPSTFISNDIVVPSSIFPTAWNGWVDGNGNPDCPNSGTNGYYNLAHCPADPKTGDTGPWNYAA